jgi:hypothetical protein
LTQDKGRAIVFVYRANYATHIYEDWKVARARALTAEAFAGVPEVAKFEHPTKPRGGLGVPLAHVLPEGGPDTNEVGPNSRNEL